MKTARRSSVAVRMNAERFEPTVQQTVPLL
jgi:hypothetical protein